MGNCDVQQDRAKIEIPYPPLSLVGRSGPMASLNEFVEQGTFFLRMFVQKGLVTPAARVLDIGCGVGKLAYQCHGYLTTGEYLGIDVDAEAIAWLQRAFSADPRFTFHHLDLRNQAYNPTGAASFSGLTVADNSIDFCCLTSVFTHMKLGLTLAYLSEIRRVLRTDGKLYATFFKTLKPERISRDEQRVVHLEEDIRGMLQAYAFTVVESWGGDHEETHWHDQYQLICKVGGEYASYHFDVTAPVSSARPGIWNRLQARLRRT